MPFALNVLWAPSSPQGGQFRWLNETMYTQPGGESFRMMREEPDLFKKYHDGFR